MITTSITNTYKFVGLSTETKPKGPAVGSVYEETDTGNTFFYNGKRWVRVVEEESGGGGSFCVTITVDDSGDDPVYSADKTIAEITAAFEAGNAVVATFQENDDADNIILYFNAYGDDYAEFTAYYIDGGSLLVAYDALIYIDSDAETVEFHIIQFDLSSLIVE